MTKILKKYTSIPPHLYVERDADLQLKRIVDEMQRPGYVLVARQMGKTNLLINAKRTLESDKRIFAYVDLSNSFKYERECYLNIIDVIIETFEDVFEPIVSEIYSLRKNSLPPHKEYSKSLRIILNHFKGDIVIILDEIDALRTADYSDNIFAQIRSNYFSRTNFEEFERLTYILSGVIEPTELIKDRNKSPFNIGDKIYLDDFTLEEHNTFINKSKLRIDNVISTEIYKWSNGNPRLTFDICSEIEDQIISEKSITKESISLIIKEKYLTLYDIAPIDHIRELVKSNKDVRQAIVQLQNNTNDISDELKKKLYLFGIINSQFNKTTKIKNRIIKESLSIDWVNSVDKSSKNITITYGLAKFDSKEYDDAITIFETLLNNSPSNNDLETIKYFLGYSFYHLRNYEKTLRHLSFNFSDAENKRKALSAVGICKIASGNLTDGYNDLEEVIKTRTNDFAYHTALYNIALNKLNTDPKKASSFFTELFDSADEIIKDDKDGRTSEEINNLKSSCLYHQAIIEIENNENSSKGIELLQSALNLASKQNSIYIEFSLNELNKNKKSNYKEELVNSIVLNKLTFEKENTYPTSFNERHLSNYLGYLFNRDDNTLYKKLLKYSYKYIYNKEVSKSIISYRASKISNNSKQILESLLNIKEKDILKQVYYDLAIIENKNSITFFEYFDKFKTIVNRISANDLYIYAIAIRKLFDEKKIEEGINLCVETINEIEKINDEVLNYESVIIYYWLSIFYDTKNDVVNAKSTATKTIEIIKLSSLENQTSMIDEKALKLIQGQMIDMIFPNEFVKNHNISHKKYGRNDRIKVLYKNADIIEGKYKKLEKDIISGDCVII
jgi:tetratricopeptide (TPR) repeat protein